MKILFVLHSFNNRGGTELHTRALMEGVQDQHDTYVVFPEPDQKSGYYLFLKSLSRELARYPVKKQSWPIDLWEDLSFSSALKSILNVVKPDLIHVQHIFNWPLGSLEQLIDFGVPVVISFHDYYFITPDFTMQGISDPKDCFLPQSSEKVFGKDLSMALMKRAELLAEQVSRSSKRVVPSSYLASVLDMIFPGSYTVIEHGVKNSEGSKPSSYGSESAPIFGYIGSLLPQKGWSTLIRAFAQVRERFPETRLKIFGGFTDLPEELREGVSFEGVYEVSQLDDIVSKFDIGVIPSIFAETFSLTLSELWMRGVPVIASKIGVLQERVTDRSNGLFFEAGNVDDLAQKMEWFCVNTEWRSWNLPRVKTVEEMVEDYLNLYRSLER